MHLHRATGTGSMSAPSGGGDSRVCQPKRGTRRRTVDDRIRGCCSSLAPGANCPFVSNASTLAIVPSKPTSSGADTATSCTNRTDITSNGGATPITSLTAVDLNRALAAHLIQSVEFVFRQRHRRGRDILEEVGDFGGSRDRHNDWRSRQKPRQRDLRRRRVLLRCHTTKRTIRAGELTSCQREPRDEDDVVLLTVIQNVLRSAIGHAIAILHARDGDDRSRVLKLADAHFR